MNDGASVFRNVRFLSGSVRAGFPSPASDYEEKKLDINDLVVPHPVSTYFMKVEGDSMTGACIYSGDIVVVDRAITATHNKIIIARLGEDFTLKRLEIVNRRKIFLKPENPKYTVIEATHHGDFEIWGVVTWVLHKQMRSLDKTSL